MHRVTGKRAVCLLICLLLVVATGAIVLSADEPVVSNGYTITEPYEYPAIPGTDGWKGFTTHMQMIKACQVPEEILEKMTIEALLMTVMDFPLLGDAFLFDDIDAGYAALKRNCNALEVLLAREDVARVFEMYRVKQG